MPAVSPASPAALARVCPACNAQPGQPCSIPSSTGRNPVAWAHYSREAL